MKMQTNSLSLTTRKRKRMEMQKSSLSEATIVSLAKEATTKKFTEVAKVLRLLTGQADVSRWIPLIPEPNISQTPAHRKVEPSQPIPLIDLSVEHVDLGRIGYVIRTDSIDGVVDAMFHHGCIRTDSIDGVLDAMFHHGCIYAVTKGGFSEWMDSVIHNDNWLIRRIIDHVPFHSIRCSVNWWEPIQRSIHPQIMTPRILIYLGMLNARDLAKVPDPLLSQEALVAYVAQNSIDFKRMSEPLVDYLSSDRRFGFHWRQVLRKVAHADQVKL